MKIPKDQDLALTVFLSISLFVVLLFWIFLPANIQLHDEDEEAEAIKVLKPDEAVFAVGEILTQAEESVARLEEEAEEKEGDQTEGGKK